VKCSTSRVPAASPGVALVQDAARTSLRAHGGPKSQEITARGLRGADLYRAHRARHGLSYTHYSTAGLRHRRVPMAAIVYHQRAVTPLDDKRRNSSGRQGWPSSTGAGVVDLRAGRHWPNSGTQVSVQSSSRPRCSVHAGRDIEHRSRSKYNSPSIGITAKAGFISSVLISASGCSITAAKRFSPARSPVSHGEKRPMSRRRTWPDTARRRRGADSAATTASRRLLSAA
jgi:hypothetical protein